MGIPYEGWGAHGEYRERMKHVLEQTATRACGHHSVVSTKKDPKILAKYPILATIPAWEM